MSNIKRVNISSAGDQANNYSEFPSISGDGRYISFTSPASNLVENDTNGYPDIFVHDRLTGKTEQVSISGTGEQANSGSYHSSISADGRYIAFDLSATNLIGDNKVGNVLVHDRLTGKTERVSVSSSGVPGNAYSSNPSISADGRYVVFESRANNLIDGTTTTRLNRNIFIHDRVTGKTERVSVSGKGIQGDNWSGYSSISADGRYVAFVSSASNLVDGDTNMKIDVFVHDRVTGKTERVSVDNTGIQGNWWSEDPFISANGRYVAFVSASSYLVAGDTNRVADIFVRDRGVTDFLSPVTAVSLNGTPGQNNWHTSNVQLNLTASDNEGGSGVAKTEYSFDGTNWITYTAPFTVSTEGTTKVYYRSTDKAGNIEATKEQLIKIDKTPPTISGAATTPPNANGWYNSDVAVHFTASDTVSGIDAVTPDITISTEGTDQSVTGTAIDQAGNSASFNVTGINIDKTPPQVTVNAPADGSEYLLNENVPADWSAADALSGLALATGTVVGGQAIDTSTVGTKTFTVVATDNAGNQITKTVTYHVGYAYSGILSPIKGDGSSVFKQGSTVPVKFQLKDANGSFVTGATVKLYVAKVDNGTVGEELEAVSTSAATTGNLFRYESTDNQYIFNLSTKGLSTGTWQLRILLDDGTSKYAVIPLK